MKTKLILLIYLSATSIILNAQNISFVWAKQLGGSYHDIGYSVVADNSGNVYTTGQFQGTADFDPGTGIFNLVSAGDMDIFICKLNYSGNFIWAKRIGGISADRGTSIAVDAAGDVFITGYFQGTVDFNPGTGVYNLVSAGGRDIFICKISSSGNFIWAKQIGGSSDDRGLSVTTDLSGNVHASGIFWGTAGIDTGSGMYYFTANGGYDVFIVKLDPSGNFIWIRQFGGLTYDMGNSITVDASGNVFTTGSFNGSVDFDPGTGNYTLTSAGLEDIFVHKMDASGNFIWAVQMGSYMSDQGNSIEIDAAGNIYTTGMFSSPADFDPGPGTYYLTDNFMFISKLDGSGNFLWAKQLGGYSIASGQSIAIDASCNIYTTGMFTNTPDFDPGTGTCSFTSFGWDDIFISKLDQAGNFIWAGQFGGTYDECGYSIAVDNAGNIYITGYFSGTADFNPGPGNYNMTSQTGANDPTDIFIVKLCQTTFSELTVSSCDSYVSPSGIYFWISSGTYYDTLTNFHGCDSIITFYLTIINSSTNFISPTVCDSYTSPSGNCTWTTSGTYTDTLINSMGCDSVITVYLTILNATNSIFPTVCDSYISPSGNYTWTSSGTYSDTLVNSQGCDSVITVNLTVLSNSTSSIFATACESYASPSGNYTWITSGLYTDTLISSLGCDSVLSIYLTIIENTTNSITQTACSSYTSPSGNYAWTSSGTYTDTIINSTGCDSVITVNLTVLNNTTNTISPIACESFTSPSGNYLWSTSGNYSDTLTNSVGCDSIITIVLTILNSSTSAINPTACNSYTSPSGNYTWTSSGLYSDTMVNSQGCDSIIFIYLTVNTVDSTVTNNSPTLTSNAAMATYQWIYCDSVPVPGETDQSFTATANGNYAVIVEYNGCVDTSVCITISNIGINQYATNNNVHIYPNPTNSRIVIDLGIENEKSEITIINSLGQVVSRKQERSALINLEINGGSGLYLVIIRTVDKTVGLKIIKN